MNRNTLSQGEPWMTPEERQLNREFVQSTADRLAARGIPETPFILIRINDVIATWLLARRLEAALTTKPGEAAPCPSPAQAGAIGKCRDRLRRAMKELEACCPSDANPVQESLAGQTHEVAQQDAEKDPASNYASPSETQAPESAEQKRTNPNNPQESENHHPTPPMTAHPPEPHHTPIEESPTLNRAARRRQEREARYNKKGRRSSSTPQGPGHRTTGGRRAP